MNVKRPTSNVKRLLGLPLSTFHVSRSTFDVLPLLRALVWKEWRQLRGLYVLLVAVGWTALASGPLWSGFYAAGTAFVVLAIGCPIVLSAAAFAGETETGTKAYLNSLPVSAAGLATVKVAGVVCLSLTATAAGVALLMIQREPDSVAPLGEWGQLFVLVLLLCPVLVSAAAVVASTGVGSMATVLAGVLLSAGWTVWLGVCATFLRRCTPGWSATVAMAGAASLLAACSAVWLLGRSLRGAASPVRAGAAALLLPVYCAAGPAGICISEMLLETPSAYLAPPPRARHDRLDAMPGRRYVALACRDRRWSLGHRTAVLDPHTGEWQWLTRARVSVVVGHRASQSTWSSDGRKLLFLRSDGWRRPAKKREPEMPLGWDGPWPFGDCPRRFEQWVFDAERGDSRPLPLPADPNRHPAWFDDRTVFVVRDDRLEFIDIETGALSRCATPLIDGRPPLRDANGAMRGASSLFLWTHVAPRSETDRTTLAVFRYALGMTEAEVQRLTIARDAGRILGVSDDERWLLACGFPRQGRTPQPPLILLMALATGEVRSLALPEEISPLGWAFSLNWRGGPRFRENRVVFPLRNGVMAYDIDRDAWSEPVRVRGVPEDSEEAFWAHSHGRLSPSGRFTLVAGVAGRGCAWHVADVETRETREVWPDDGERTEAAWLGDDMILIHKPTGLWTVRRDGSGRRKLLP